MDFDSTNPYQSLAVISAESPQELVDKLKSIKTPYKILSMNQVGNRSVAYIIGDHRIKTQRKVKNNGRKTSKRS